MYPNPGIIECVDIGLFDSQRIAVLPIILNLKMLQNDCDHHIEDDEGDDDCERQKVRDGQM